MKKIILSTLAALTLSSVTLSALELYQDTNGQVFTSPANGRTLIKDKSLSVFSHANKLKFSGLTYIGATADDYKQSDKGTTAQMEIRRAYFQLKAYFLQDPKSYYRVTFDMSKDVTGDEKLRAKYAYIYLNEILPVTGVEIGLIHRPWHDYEEHDSWYFRSISKILIEDSKSGPGLSNSADFGFMFKTRTKYFDADYGLFNGEGYHAFQNPQAPASLSFEWRATTHLLGVNGRDKQTKKTYWDASFFGQYNMKHKNATIGTQKEDQDLIFGGLHTVFNMPSFLVSAQYVKSENTSKIQNNISQQAGSGYSTNVEYRLGSDKKYSLLARYDSWTPDVVPIGQASTKQDKSYIVGSAWKENKNIQWIANAIITDNEKGSKKELNNGVAYMVTARVNF